MPQTTKHLTISSHWAHGFTGCRSILQSLPELTLFKFNNLYMSAAKLLFHQLHILVKLDRFSSHNYTTIIYIRRAEKAPYADYCTLASARTCLCVWHTAVSLSIKITCEIPAGGFTGADDLLDSLGTAWGPLMTHYRGAKGVYMERSSNR